MNIAKIKIEPMRKAFPREARDFTTWLETNIDALSLRIGIELAVVEREKAVGSFNVDLVCEDAAGNRVIIENQLERTDHDHLGKLLTYLVNLEAKTAIWVTPEVRPEHERVIDWLNEVVGADYAFYLVQVEAVRIGTSPFAPLFTVKAGPDEQTREIGETKKELADRHVRHREFWTQLLERSKKRTTLFSGRSPSLDSWLGTGSGRSGVEFVYVILKHGARAELYINSSERDRNKAIFDALYSQKDAVEAEFGEELTWSRLDEKRASRISWHTSEHGNVNQPETWPTLQDALIDAMIRLDKALRPRIAKLNVQ